MAKRLKGRVFAIGLAVMLPAALVAQTNNPGQEIGSGTPPELRDFRLDQPAPRPGPEQGPPPPAPAPVEPPPAIPTVEAPASKEPAAPARPQAAAVSPARQGRARDETSESGSSAKSELSPAPAPADDNDKAASEASAGAPDAPPAPAEPAGSAMTPSTGDAIGRPWLTWAAGAAALLAALIAALFFWRRRRSQTNQLQDYQFDEQRPAMQPSPPARLNQPGPDSKKTPEPGAPEPEKTPILSVSFEPTDAQLSIASLTITGKLKVENRGTAAATGLALRSQMISAQDGQKEAIEAFHSNHGDGEIQPLGDLAAGERIDAIIEIRLPRAELHAFRWTEREFVAPIVLINVAGQMGDQPVEARLSQLIGREGEMSSPRMKPLAIDRGPRRYRGVSARPVFA